MILTEIPNPQNILSTFTPFGSSALRAHIMSNQALLGSTLPYTKGFVDISPYPETTTQWLISLLELFTSIVNRNEDLSQVVVTETEYQQLLEFLDDFIHIVGEDENHPLTATMTLIGGLIKAYEDQHFPKLNTLFPELTEGHLLKLMATIVMRLLRFQDRLTQISSSYYIPSVVSFGMVVRQIELFLHPT